MTAPEIVSIIGALAAAIVSVIAAWRGENVRQQLQQHVQGCPAGSQPGKRPSSQ